MSLGRAEARPKGRELGVRPFRERPRILRFARRATTAKCSPESDKGGVGSGEASTGWEGNEVKRFASRDNSSRSSHLDNCSGSAVSKLWDTSNTKSCRKRPTSGGRFLNRLWLKTRVARLAAALSLGDPKHGGTSTSPHPLTSSRDSFGQNRADTGNNAAPCDCGDCGCDDVDNVDDDANDDVSLRRRLLVIAEKRRVVGVAAVTVFEEAVGGDGGRGFWFLVEEAKRQQRTLTAPSPTLPPPGCCLLLWLLWRRNRSSPGHGKLTRTPARSKLALAMTSARSPTLCPNEASRLATCPHATALHGSRLEAHSCAHRDARGTCSNSTSAAHLRASTASAPSAPPTKPSQPPPTITATDNDGDAFFPDPPPSLPEAAAAAALVKAATTANISRPSPSASSSSFETPSAPPPPLVVKSKTTLVATAATAECIKAPTCDDDDDDEGDDEAAGAGCCCDEALG
mmetsp:Transcript_66289/g.133554  ORF Transcript_66289/g.133554 Transcript_66289/m.133554 type:complete len:458 (-) Transcript_66289:237-1610(-)